MFSSLWFLALPSARYSTSNVSSAPFNRYGPQTAQRCPPPFPTPTRLLSTVSSPIGWLTLLGSSPSLPLHPTACTAAVCEACFRSLQTLTILSPVSKTFNVLQSSLQNREFLPLFLSPDLFLILKPDVKTVFAVSLSIHCYTKRTFLNRFDTNTQENG